jgi:hypothetical protein
MILASFLLLDDVEELLFEREMRLQAVTHAT